MPSFCWISFSVPTISLDEVQSCADYSFIGYSFLTRVADI